MNKEKQREYDRRYRERNREKILERHRRYKEEQKAKDPEGWKRRVLNSVKKYQNKNKGKHHEDFIPFDNPQRTRCRWEVRKAIKKGVLVRPETCSNCGKKSKRIEGHHPDYNKPLEVIWLCRSCHWFFNKRDHGE